MKGESTLIQVKDWLLPICKARPGKKLRAFSGITIHETANTKATANAKSHATYMNVNGGANKEVSYHYVADDEEIYHLIPDNEVAWHAGDGGNGNGNNETIAIEICVNNGANFKQAVNNAAYLCASLLHERGIKDVKGFIFEHHDFSAYKKNCPANLRGGSVGGMFYLRQKAQQYLDEMNGVTVGVDEPGKKLYRVQVGAFSSEAAARAYSEKVRAGGFENFITDATKGG